MIRALTSSRRALAFGALIALGALAAATVLVMRVGGNEPAFIPSSEKVYTEGVAGTWQRINPIFATENEVDADLSRLIFAGLVRVGPDGQVLPDMAGLPEISEGGRTYTFRLRDDLQWHDGRPVTSQDVRFTIERITDPDFRGSPALAEAWASAEVIIPDLRTVVIRLPQPSAPFLARWATIGIIPAHGFRDTTAAAIYDAPFNAAPIGSGPYRLEALNSEEARLVANPRYHLGRPAIDVIRLRFFTDYPTALRDLQDGAIDGLLIRDDLTAAQLDALRQAGHLNVETRQRAAFFALYLNNDQALFEDERVRRAINIAIDRMSLVEDQLLGLATPSSSPIAPGTWAYAADYDTLSPAIDDARALLAAAGWEPDPTTGILVRQGAEFRFTIRTDNNSARMALAAAIAHQLEDLGIKVNVASTPFSVLRRDFLEERRYDAAVVGWDQGPDPDPYDGWHSSQAGASGVNIANFADVVADSLIAQGRTSTDPQIRVEAYRQFQEIWQQQAPSAVVAYPHFVYARTTRLQPAEPAILFSPADRFFDVHLWKI